MGDRIGSHRELEQGDNGFAQGAKVPHFPAESSRKRMTILR
jgi:hypothetical protein